MPNSLHRQFATALRAATAVAVLAAAAPKRASGQSPLQVGDVLSTYLRVLQVGGLAQAPSFFMQPLPANVLPDSVGPWAGHLNPAPVHTLGGIRAVLDPARMRITENTTTPFGQNDDAMWQGRGVNFALDGGATMMWRALTVTLHPTLVWSQNQAFPLAPVSDTLALPYAYPWRTIDLPQRFGPHAYSRLDPGQSAVALTTHGVRASFGTENLWWGPGIQTAILMTNDAPGFPHAALATSQPVDIGIGALEAQWIWGRLQQSGWYRGTDSAQSRFYTGAEVAFSPGWAFLKGFTIGGARAFVQDVPPNGLSASDYLAVLRLATKQSFATAANPSGDDARDQLLSFQFRWTLPASGFETYAEWARNDFAWNLTDFLLEPEHSQAYTLGFQKVGTVSGGRLLTLNGELTHLERDPTRQTRDDPPYYAHSYVQRGYTQEGQMIGSALGPGGDGQYLGADVYTTRGRWGLFVQRQVHDNDAFYDRALTPADSSWAHDVSLSFGGRTTVFTHGLEVEFDATLTKELNRYMQLRNSVWNGNVGVTMRWRPR